jgi:hypothetical protein
MHTPQSWIVCERSGRWTAALRVAIARRFPRSARWAPLPPIVEVRSLTELKQAAAESSFAIALIESRADNLLAVLELVSQHSRNAISCIALLDDELRTVATASDALSEAGVVAVIPTPRHLSTALQLAAKCAATRPPLLAPDLSISFIERLQAALPWQDS